VLAVAVVVLAVELAVVRRQKEEEALKRGSTVSTTAWAYVRSTCVFECFPPQGEAMRLLLQLLPWLDCCLKRGLVPTAETTHTTATTGTTTTATPSTTTTTILSTAVTVVKKSRKAKVWVVVDRFRSR
jgi:hypothetical protein